MPSDPTEKEITEKLAASVKNMLLTISDKGHNAKFANVNLFDPFSLINVLDSMMDFNIVVVETLLSMRNDNNTKEAFDKLVLQLRPTSNNVLRLKEEILVKMLASIDAHSMNGESE